MLQYHLLAILEPEDSSNYLTISMLLANSVSYTRYVQDRYVIMVARQVCSESGLLAV